MKMWPQSHNISVMSPPVKKLLGRPEKNRKKEEGETKKKTGKLSKRGIEISCGTCHSKGHNKRRCLTGAPAAGTNANPGPSPSAGADPGAGPSAAPTVEKGRGSTGRGRGRPSKNSTEKCVDIPRMVGMGLLHTQSGCTILNMQKKKIFPLDLFLVHLMNRIRNSQRIGQSIETTPVTMKKLRDKAASRSKKSSSKTASKKKFDDSGRPRLPKHSYKNIQPTIEEVCRLNLSFFKDFEIFDPTTSASTSITGTLKRSADKFQQRVGIITEEFGDFSTIPPREILIKAGLASPLSPDQPLKRRRL
ncbi:hypothetical protein CQW23_22045 [Capsicum baccatum]|uniref:Uncharacterized protein n=1 Tax=Capsicum baccatum TaxID=33114 RepID=A0A2G2VZR5_CAPBA|nr:hypothetical protein CQW23_22045 [Capsicum baccatum]